MTKRDFFFLLLPSVFIAVFAIYALRFSRLISDDHFLSNNADFVKMSQANFDEFVMKVYSGEVKLSPDKVITLLRSCRKGDETNRQLISASSKMTQALGLLGLVGVIVHTYVVVRFKTASKKAVSNQCVS